MAVRTGWTRQQLLVAFDLYCRMPFGKMHSRNPEIIRYAEQIGRTPSALAMKLTNIASLDPAITSTGRRGLSGASTADKAMWDEMQADWEAFAVEAQRAMGALDVADTSRSEGSDVAPTDGEADHTGSEREVAAKARVGQAFFRRAVLSAYDYRCCISGLAVPSLLVASHIVPWREDAKNRLNPRNGLCLSMLHDKAFDIGIITIAEDMTIRVAKDRATESDAFFNSTLLVYDGKPITLPEKFRPDSAFLTHHRQWFTGRT